MNQVCVRARVPECVCVRVLFCFCFSMTACLMVVLAPTGLPVWSAYASWQRLTRNRVKKCRLSSGIISPILSDSNRSLHPVWSKKSPSLADFACFTFQRVSSEIHNFENSLPLWCHKLVWWIRSATNPPSQVLAPPSGTTLSVFHPNAHTWKKQHF